jgi:hypothetical protein
MGRWPCLVLTLSVGCRAGDTDAGDTDDTAIPPVQTRLGLCDGWDSAVLHSVDDAAAEDRDAADASRLGLGLVRPHRPSGGPFAMDVVRAPRTADDDWSIPDHVVATAGAAGLAVFGTLTPHADVDGTGPVQPAVPPDQQAAWIAFVGRAVERYDGDGVDDMPGLTRPVLAWEIGNEPTCPAGDGACAGRYLDVLVESYDAAKQASSETPVLMGGAAPVFTSLDGAVNQGTFDLYSWLFEHGASAYTDAFNFHTLSGAPGPDVDAYVTTWTPVVGDEPLWLGEIATRSKDDAFVVEPSPDQEAAWLAGTLDRAFDLGVERVLWCKTGDIDRLGAVEATIADEAASLQD